MLSGYENGRPLAIKAAGEIPAKWTGLLWLHAERPSPEDIEALSHRFSLHPLIAEDLQHGNQRPKIDDYNDSIFLVLFGAIQDAGSVSLSELHVVLGENYLISIATDAIPPISDLQHRIEVRPELAQGDSGKLLYHLCDSLVDSVFPLLDKVAGDIDRVEDEILKKPDRGTLSDIFVLKRDLAALRRILGPQRDLLQSLTAPRTSLIHTDVQLYLRDVYDHTVRMVEEVDSFRDLVSSALDAYLTSVSNRLGEQTRRLTLVATVFLPLGFLTSFFGMNFGFLTGHITGGTAFALGLALMAVSVVVNLAIVNLLNRRAQPLPADHLQRRRQRLLPRRRRSPA